MDRSCMVEFLGMFKRQFGGINMKYSIIYGVIRPEIAEQLSVGIIIVDGDEISVRYSTKKMNVMKALYTESEYKFLGKVLRSLSKNGSIQSTDVINYLTRYSNNLIAVSKLQTINLEPTKKNKEWLYKNYVQGRA